jgi:glycogen debranching enzyme
MAQWFVKRYAMVQPYLHEHVTCVAAPATWLSRASGQVVDGVDGLYVDDRRLVSRLVVTVDGRHPEPLSARSTGARAAEFTGVARDLGDGGADPTVFVIRRRAARPDGGTEEITLVNRARVAVSATIGLAVGGDFAPMGLVKDGKPAGPMWPLRPVPGGPAGDGAPSTAGRSGGRVGDGVPSNAGGSGGRVGDGVGSAAGGFGWRADDGATGALGCEPAPDAVVDGRLTWRVEVPARSSWSVRLRLSRTDRTPAQVTLPAAGLTVTSTDRRLDHLVRASVDDLDALRLRDDGDTYYAAGSPWYLTLFGRDSLWAARLALPLGWQVAAGTLRTLARRQGTRTDPATDEEPGKILHEVRPPDAATWLAPVYYGSVDATALFVTTLAEAHRWGMPAAEVTPLLSNVERALTWLAGHDPFVSYQPGGPGLTNQGWKDSNDGVQHADGRIATPPLSLSEVQAYAYRAAVDGAWLLDTLGAGGGDRWRAWAAALAQRFRDAFWCDGYPAIALDGDGRPVDGPASNMGHLLGTGLLDGDEAAAVVRRLTAGELASPYGLRTLATSAAGYNPVSYHAGSVWPHDTAIALLGMVADGHPRAAAGLIEALLEAAYRFDFRLPELFAGDDVPTPYPPSCRPQAWAAAVGPALLTALLGLRPDVPAGRVTIAPIAPSPVGAFQVRGLRVGDGILDVDVSADGHPTVLGAPPGVRVDGQRTRLVS